MLPAASGPVPGWRDVEKGEDKEVAGNGAAVPKATRWPPLSSQDSGELGPPSSSPAFLPPPTPPQRPAQP